MINTILIDCDPGSLRSLEVLLNNYPSIQILAKATCHSRIPSMVQQFHPDLIFINLSGENPQEKPILKELAFYELEFIVLAQYRDFAVEAINHSAAGYLLKPVVAEDLFMSIKNAMRRIEFRKEHIKNKEIMTRLMGQFSYNELIAVPTIEGFNFLQVGEIIRCEGMQKCTRIITKSKKDLISSYNIGEYKRLLEPYSFFAPHKSHLINLAYMKYYSKEGTIVMIDNSAVPVSKRRKGEFLKSVTHIQKPAISL